MLPRRAAYRVGNVGLVMSANMITLNLEIVSACAAAALYRRSLFQDIGGFDEDFFAYCEDVDLGLRAQLRGHRCHTAYVPKARVRHHGSATMGATFHPKIMRLTSRAIACFVILKNYPMAIFFRLMPRLIVFQVLWLIFAIRKRAFLASCMGRRRRLCCLLAGCWPRGPRFNRRDL